MSEERWYERKDSSGNKYFVKEEYTESGGGGYQDRPTFWLIFQIIFTVIATLIGLYLGLRSLLVVLDKFEKGGDSLVLFPEFLWSLFKIPFYTFCFFFIGDWIGDKISDIFKYKY